MCGSLVMCVVLSPPSYKQKCQYLRQEDDHSQLTVSYQEMPLVVSDGIKIPKDARKSPRVTRPLHKSCCCPSLPSRCVYPHMVTTLTCCCLLLWAIIKPHPASSHPKHRKNLMMTMMQNLEVELQGEQWMKVKDWL